MTARSISLNGGRKLTFDSVAGLGEIAIQPPFVALLPAYCLTDRQQGEVVASRLISSGCVEFCCVGPEAEVLHDALDAVIEGEGALDVVTTWVGDPMEACEYFLHAAAGGCANLLALTQCHVDLQMILQDESERPS